MERPRRWGAELAQHIKPQAKREAQSCVPESPSPNLERWGSLCREDGARKKENKDGNKQDIRGHLEKAEGRRQGGENKPTAGGNKI